MQTGGNQAGKVSHVDPKLCANLVGDLAELGEVEVTAVGRPSGDEHVRLDLVRTLAHNIHVDQESVWVQAIGVSLIHLARKVEAHAVGEVATVSKFKTEDAVARVCQRHKHSGVRARTRVWLHVGVLGTE